MTALRDALLAEVDAVPNPSRRSFPMPMHVLQTEALALAAFVRAHWDASEAHPGLAGAALRFDAQVSDDLIALVEAARAQDNAFRLARTPAPSRDLLERATALLRELSAALRFLFDDGTHDERHAQLAAVSKPQRRRSNSADALTAALHGHAALAQKHRDALAQLGGFDVATIDEALALVPTLRARRANRAQRPSQQATAHRVRRNRIHVVLMHKIKLVRAAVRFAFRDHPNLVAQSASAYERHKRKRRARRRVAVS